MIERPVALVTGANKGIGFEIARQLGQRGAMVLVGARNASRGEAAAARLREEGLYAALLLVDVTDPRSIREAAERVRADYSRLDILVNNAGVLLDKRPPSETDLLTLQQTFAANVFGPILMSQAMLPLLRRSARPRIVTLSSNLGSFAVVTDPASPFYDHNLLAYNASKAALNAATVALAKELRDTGIKVNAADPGYTATDLNQHQGTRTVEEGARAAVQLALLGPEGPTGQFFDEEGTVPW
jgi:NAD(P)-dependent dehydrogenase (short-subunit alcohol dehydrogenase family)